MAPSRKAKPRVSSRKSLRRQPTLNAEIERLNLELRSTTARLEREMSAVKETMRLYYRHNWDDEKNKMISVLSRQLATAVSEAEARIRTRVDDFGPILADFQKCYIAMRRAINYDV